MSNKSLLSVLFFLIIFSFQNFVNSTVLTKYFLKNAPQRNAVCNDGTTPIFFVRTNPSSTNWFIYHEGGGGCYSIESCNDRYANARFLMSSNGYNDSISAASVFSDDCKVNPAFCNDNLAYIHYCTSDWHSGNRTKSAETGNFYFFGKNVIFSVVEDLFDDFELGKATRVVLSGSSAGGVGTWSNSDMIGDYVKRRVPSVDYSVISDSGWFLDGKTFKDWPCTTQGHCSYEERLKRGQEYWGLVPHEECGKNHFDDSWKCLVGYIVYPFIKARKMSTHYLTDSWQASQDGVNKNSVKKMDIKEKRWVFKRGEFVEKKVDELKMEEEGVWVAGCFVHCTFGAGTYNNFKTNDGVSPAEAVNNFVNHVTPKNVDRCKVIECNKVCHDRANINKKTVCSSHPDQVNFC